MMLCFLPIHFQVEKPRIAYHIHIVNTFKIESGRLVEVLDRYRNDREGIWALYPQKHHLLPKVRLLVDYLLKSL